MELLFGTYIFCSCCCISSADPFSWCWLSFACLCLYMHLHFLLCSFFLVYNKPDCVSFFPGRIVSDSDHFHNKMHIWPEGYTAFRKFASVKGICSVPDCHQACMKFGVPFWNSLLSWEYVLRVHCNTFTDPHLVTSYKMEVLRNSDIKARPLFRVISEDGLQVSKLII